MSIREATKALARAVATLIVLPAVASFRLKSAVLGRDRAIEGSTQALALVPGLLGQYIRRAFLVRALEQCDATAVVEFGTVFSQVGARLERNVYVGPGCHLGLVHLEPDVLIASGVHIPSGGDTHGTDDPDVPIREQRSDRRMVRIGKGSWIGSGAVVLADVGQNTIVGAGAVVTRPLPPRVVAAGVPARVVRPRDISPAVAGELNDHAERPSA